VNEKSLLPDNTGEIPLKKYKNIVWDWNGTLLDDIAVSVKTLNRMLATRALPPVTATAYRERFGFPVRPYYESLGFDLDTEGWGAISEEYVALYRSLSREVALTEGVRALLPAIRRAGIRQYVLSALREDLLEAMLERFGIRPFFNGVCGVDNIHADGKIARGREMLARCPILPEESVMIGDTLHDAEVATALGLRARLYTGGHNSAERLQRQGHAFHRMTDLLPELL
jgi:phosphoglycolate phosphatase